MKIIKHAREVAQSGAASPASGQLLGIDSAGVLNVSDAFPLPSGSLGSIAEGEDKQANQKTSTLNDVHFFFVDVVNSVFFSLYSDMDFSSQLPDIPPPSSPDSLRSAPTPM